MPRITVISMQDSVFDFGEEIITIGRSEECSIPIPMKSVSRLHAKLSPAAEGWLLEDMDSHNGLFINSSRVKSTLLKRTTTFRTGDVYIRFELPISKEELLKIAGDAKEILGEFNRAVTGRNNLGMNMLTAAMAGGGILLNGVPGEGKTTAVKTMAEILSMPFRKIPLTPDTMPQDIIGNEVILEDSSGLATRFTPGPIFSNMILADNLNSAPAKTQAALIEAVSLGKVPVGSEYEYLPSPMLLAASRNTITGAEDTPLSADILDYFMISLNVDYPSPQDEIKIIAASSGPGKMPVRNLMNMESIPALQEQVRCTAVTDELISYAGRIVRSSRPDNPDAPDFIKKSLIHGASTKAASDLILCAKARALLNGKSQPDFEDVKTMAIPVLQHRIQLNSKISEGRTEDDIIRRLLMTVNEAES